MNIKFGLHVRTQYPALYNHQECFNNLMHECKLAEEKGYDSVWVGEHHTSHAAHFPPLLTLAAVSQHTKKIKLGTGVLILPLHNPLSIAEDFAMLDIISGGRAIIGIGIGFRKEEFNAFGVSLSNRAKRFEEQLKIIKKLLEEHSVTYEGEFYYLNNVTMNLKCVQDPRPPIWIGVGGAAPLTAIERAAKLSEGIFIDPIVNLNKAKEMSMKFLEFVRTHQNRKAEIALFRECVIADRSAAEEANKYVINKYLDYIRWGLPAIKQEFPNPHDVDMSKLFERFLVGNPSEVIEQIDKYLKEVKVTYFIIRLNHIGMTHDMVLEKMRLFADKVLKYFKEES